MNTSRFDLYPSTEEHKRILDDSIKVQAMKQRIMEELETYHLSDEIRLLKGLLTRHYARDVVKSSGVDGAVAAWIMGALWCDSNLWEYGTSLFAGWFTDLGREHAKELTGYLPYSHDECIGAENRYLKSIGYRGRGYGSLDFEARGLLLKPEARQWVEAAYYQDRTIEPVEAIPFDPIKEARLIEQIKQVTRLSMQGEWICKQVDYLGWSEDLNQAEMNFQESNYIGYWAHDPDNARWL